MALYKAKKSLFELDNQYFGVHKIKAFKEGQYLEITEPNKLPKKVLECLELKNSKKKKKGDK
tara:strand:+ start:78 stop:263 length:186 start_codon:yes stop_codon:yes gene_type:complete